MLYRIKNTRKKITEKYGHKEEQTKLISHSRIRKSGQGGSVLSGSVPYLCFTTITQCNDLTYLKEYSVRQNIIYKLIRHLHEKEGMGYRRISAFMNCSGIKSERGKKFSNAIVQSILKRKKERDMRIEYFNHS